MVDNNGNVFENERFIPDYDASGKNSGKKKMLPWWIGIASGVVIGIVAVLIYYFATTGSGFFVEEFPEIVQNSWCQVNSDGSSMMIYCSFGSESEKAVKDVCEKLDLPDVTEDISEEIDRRRDAGESLDDYYGYEENDDYIVSWAVEYYGETIVSFVCK